MTAIRGARERARAEVTAAIKEEARRQLAFDFRNPAAQIKAEQAQVDSELIPNELPGAKEPFKTIELLDYEIRVDQNANDRYGAFRVGTHDDLVTALGLATQDDGPRPFHAAAGGLRSPLAAMADQMRRDTGSENIALSQGHAHEPEFTRSKVAEPTVDQARGGR